jgi:hypothetical protein
MASEVFDTWPGGFWDLGSDMEVLGFSPKTNNKIIEFNVNSHKFVQRRMKGWMSTRCFDDKIWGGKEENKKLTSNLST